MRSWMSGLLAMVLACGLALGMVDSAASKTVPAGDLSFEVFKDSKKDFRWKLKAANGKVMAVSEEGYSSKSSCKSAIEWIKNHAAKAEIEDLTTER